MRIAQYSVTFLFSVKKKALYQFMKFFPNFSLFSLSTKEVNLVQLTHSSFFLFLISLLLENRHSVFMYAET